MTELARVAAISDLPPGSSGEFVVKGRMVALFNVDGNIHALDGVCPHAGGPLGEGKLEGNVVTCPWHGWQVDVETGQHCLNANLSHQRYNVEIKDDDVFIELP